MTKRAAEQSQKAESKAQQLSQNFLNGQLDSIQKNTLKVWARPTVVVTVEEDKEEAEVTDIEWTFVVLRYYKFKIQIKILFFS